MIAWFTLALAATSPGDRLGPMPIPAAPAPWAPPKPATARLSNGASAWIVPDASLPLVTLAVRVPGGARLDPPGKAGAGALASRLMTLGAGRLNREKFSEAVERLGIQLSAWVDDEDAVFWLSAHKRQLAAGIDLMAAGLLKPRFDEKEFAIERELLVAEVEQRDDDPRATAARTARWLWYGKDHPYGRPVEGSVESLRTLRTADLKAWHRSAWTATGAKVAMAGDVTEAEAVPLLNARLCDDWEGEPRTLTAVRGAPVHQDEPIYLVDKPGSAQTAFYLAFPGNTIKEWRPGPHAGAVVLGGTFTSRLNTLLREKKGYTYGVRAGLEQGRGAGHAFIRTQVRADATAAALSDILGELTSIRAGVTGEELQKARGAYRQDLVEQFETRSGVVAGLTDVHAAGLGPGELIDRLAAMMRLNGGLSADLRQWDRRAAVFVLVGDVATIQPQLQAAGHTRLEVIEAP
jgi:zinc protease